MWVSQSRGVGVNKYKMMNNLDSVLGLPVHHIYNQLTITILIHSLHKNQILSQLTDRESTSYCAFQ